MTTQDNSLSKSSSLNTKQIDYLVNWYIALTDEINGLRSLIQNALNPQYRRSVPPIITFSTAKFWEDSYERVNAINDPVLNELLINISQSHTRLIYLEKIEKLVRFMEDTNDLLLDKVWEIKNYYDKYERISCHHYVKSAQIQTPDMFLVQMHMIHLVSAKHLIKYVNTSTLWFSRIPSLMRVITNNITEKLQKLSKAKKAIKQNIGLFPVLSKQLIISRDTSAAQNAPIKDSQEDQEAADHKKIEKKAVRSFPELLTNNYTQNYLEKLLKHLLMKRDDGTCCWPQKKKSALYGVVDALRAKNYLLDSSIVESHYSLSTYLGLKETTPKYGYSSIQEETKKKALSFLNQPIKR